MVGVAAHRHITPLGRARRHYGARRQPKLGAGVDDYCGTNVLQLADGAYPRLWEGLEARRQVLTLVEPS